MHKYTILRTIPMGLCRSRPNENFSAMNNSSPGDNVLSLSRRCPDWHRLSSGQRYPVKIDLTDGATIMTRHAFLLLLLFALVSAPLTAEPAKSPYTGGNRLAYLDEINPYYPHRDFAKLTTPQWVGEEGVEAVIILSIDDMRDPVAYERYLRPILDRLKKVPNSEGKAPLSIFANSVDPKHAQLQAWLKEGLSFEVHTITHPCPCLGAGPGAHNSRSGDIRKAKETYDGCVDLIAQIPNYKGPVAFRMPCCDSMNSVSPRFFAEVMNKTTAKGNFLSIDSSVFNIFTSDDPALPRELVLEKDGDGKPRERFVKYTQFPGYINTIENYPYPYVIGNMIWQFPAVVPSDWEAQNLHGKNNPKTVEDLKAALDCTVIKQGVFTLCFHPHGWIQAEQIVQLIDHAEKKHGKKVRFLNFQEALERINKNVLAGTPIRDKKGNNPNVRVLDLDDNGFVDAVIENEKQKATHIWNASKASWHILQQQSPVLSHQEDEGPRRFASWGTELGRNVAGPFPAGTMPQGQHDAPHMVFNIEESTWNTPYFGIFTDAVVLRRAINGSVCEEIIEYEDGGSGIRDGVHRRRFFSYKLPPLVRLARDLSGADAGLRLIDLDGDGDLDVVFSNGERFDVYLFIPPVQGKGGGWATKIIATKRGVLSPEQELPPILRADGTNNGFFVKGDALYWQNEETGGVETNHVKKITFKEVLALADLRPEARDLQVPVPAAPAHNFTTAHAAPPPPRSPEASRDSIVLIPGFRAELVAAEPLVMDPIAFDFGPDGKLWVVEMGDYPSGLPGTDGKMKPSGRVVILEDTDGDGRYDERTVFLDDLNFPTGIMVWNKGVLITAAPDIFYAEDSTPEDANRKADKRVTLFTGFAEGNQQHRVNGLRWGMDGWIYVANGDSGGMIKTVTQLPGDRVLESSETLDIRGRDIRIRPHTVRSTHLGPIQVRPVDPKAPAVQLPETMDIWEIDRQSGQSQFGRDRDDFGNWFGNNNPNPGWHYALEDHYLRRNPHVAAPNPRVDLTSDRTIFPISVVHSPSIENHRISPGQSTVHSSACSLTIYRDDLYGDAFTGNAFISEPVHNLVRRLVLKQTGVTFKGERPPGEEKREFLASSDPWFRPTMTRTGPDGCLWIADMYRQTIEHPQWIPPDWQKTLDLRAGHDKGRIYRIVPVETKPRTPVRLDKLDTKGLVAAMDSPSGWQRDMVQMMWRGGDESEKAMVSLVKTAANPRVRTQAIVALDQRGQLDLQVLLDAASDVHPAVRRQVAKIGWQRKSYALFLSAENEQISPDFDAALLKLVDDVDPLVRQQLAYTIGDWPEIMDQTKQALPFIFSDPAAGKALAKILLKDAADPYIVAACMSSVLPHLDTVMQHLLAQPGGVGPHSKLVAQLIDIAVAADKLDSLGAMLDAVTQPQGDRFAAWQFASLSRLLEAMAKKKLTLGAMYEQAQKNNNRRLMMTLDRVPNVLTVARSAIVDASSEESLRLAAIDLFSRQGGDQRLPTFTAALGDVKSSPTVQQAAATAIAKLGDARAFTMILEGWRGYSPALRVSILDGLLRSDAGIAALLVALEQQVISRHDIDLPRRQPLLTHKDAAVRDRAAKLLGGAPDADRQKVIDHYTKAMAALPGGAAGGDRTRGEQVFAKNCAVCHKPATGAAIGPELAKILDSSPQALLISILDPNRAVESKYVNYLLETREGEKHTGIILSETSTSITLATLDGSQRQILRRDIAELRSTGLSLMPAGLEQAIGPQEMADLFAFIAATGPVPKKFENNTPRTIETDATGVLTLPASAAQVFGPTLIFEQQQRNLGYWSNEEDRAMWTVVITKETTFEVSIDYALDRVTKSNAFLLTVAGEQLTGPVPATGDWNRYTTLKVGTITLKPGTHSLVFRSSGRVSAALIDLRTITLKPK